MARTAALGALLAANAVVATGTPVNTQPVLWSLVFGGAGAGANITVSAEQTVLFDLANSPNYGAVVVHGTVLVSKDMDTQLNADSLVVHGLWEAGRAGALFPANRRHTLMMRGPRAAEPFLANPATSGFSANRGIVKMPGGELRLAAEVPSASYVKLADAANAAVAGTNVVRLRAPMTLKAGDKIVLTGTKYWQEGLTDAQANFSPGNTAYLARRPGWDAELLTVAADVTAGTTVTTLETLQHDHHGRIQYLVPPLLEQRPYTNLSYIPYAIQANDNFGRGPGTVQVTGQQVLTALGKLLGEYVTLEDVGRCAKLTYPIKVCAPADPDRVTHGYGVHTMAMGLTGAYEFQGVLFEEPGQAGHQGRYPLHAHVLSYTTAGVYLGDVDPATHYMKSCAVVRSSNRAVVIHGTCGLAVEDNVFYQCDTHNLLLGEEGSERRNRVRRNLAISVGLIGYNKTPIKTHDAVQQQLWVNPATGVLEVNPAYAGGALGPMGATGFWVSSPDNYFEGNITAGAFTGIWNNFSESVFGLTAAVGTNAAGAAKFIPSEADPLVWRDNEAHGCVFAGVATQPKVIAEDGRIQDAQQLYGYMPSLPDPYARPNRTLMQGMKVWKCPTWYVNEAIKPEYRGMVMSAGKFKVGERERTLVFGRIGDSSHGGVHALFTGGMFLVKTLDDAYPNDNPAGIQSYHFGGAFQNCVFVPAPMDGVMTNVYYGEPYDQVIRHKGGAIALMDIYEKFVLDLSNSTGNALLGANPGVLGMLWPPVPQLREGLSFPTATYTAKMDRPELSAAMSKTLSPARKLPADGTLMGQAGGYWLYKCDFLTWGLTGLVDAPAAPGMEGLNGVLAPNAPEFYGMKVTAVNGANVSGDTLVPADGKAIFYTRLNPATLVQASPGAVWNIPQAVQGNFPNKRFAAFPRGAVVKCGWNRVDVPLPNTLRANIEHMVDNGAVFYLCIDYNNATPVSSVRLWVNHYPATVNTFTAAANRAEVLAATTACKYFVEAGVMWLSVYAGNLVAGPTPVGDVQNDLSLYKQSTLSINGG